MHTTFFISLVNIAFANKDNHEKVFLVSTLQQVTKHGVFDSQEVSTSSRASTPVTHTALTLGL